LQRAWGQPVIVENRPGIITGTSSVAKAAGDGYTLLMVSNGHTVLGAMNKNLSFDPLKDFAGVTQVASVPFILIASPSFEVKSLKELIAAAKAQPGKLNFASPGLGTSAHILSELFKKSAGIDVVMVPYKGAPEAHTSVLRGDAQMFFSAINIGIEYVATGKVRPIAIVAKERHPKLPDVPTIGEAGLPAFSYEAWFGLLAPSSTPRAIVERIGSDIAVAIGEPDLKTSFERQGLVPAIAGPDRFDRMLRDDTERFGRLFRELGLGQN
jgi:tripartite-type tricarboxylate transporter receptor subunit TctC